MLVRVGENMSYMQAAEATVAAGGSGTLSFDFSTLSHYKNLSFEDFVVIVVPSSPPAAGNAVSIDEDNSSYDQATGTLTIGLTNSDSTNNVTVSVFVWAPHSIGK